MLDKRLAEARFLSGDDYSIADMAVFPWYGAVARGTAYEGAAKFLALDEYRHVQRWLAEVGERPAVKRGLLVNKRDGGVADRHSAEDLDALFAGHEEAPAL